MDGQMSIFDFPEYLPEEKPKPKHAFPCDNCVKDAIPERNCNTNPLVENCKEKVSDYGWNDFTTVKPPENVNVEFEYYWTWTRHNDRKGICEGSWNGKCIDWNNMPFDIGKKEVFAWRYPQGYPLTLDNLRPCDCGYSGRKAVAYVGCGSPINGYLNGKPIYESYLFSIFCPECHRTATEKSLGWKSNKTDKQQAMRDWQENPLKEPTVEGSKWFEEFANKMDETVEVFKGFI